MTRIKFVGLLIGISALLGFEPVAEAVPAAAPPSAVGISNWDGQIVQAGPVRRTARRTTRRAVRRHTY
ncbi:hypothetical protein IY145_13260 [Methylosinus sp. H3A]|uniref:hypothetical protein n=1 Tax=Methylosinus sp. H3A TaxID=2785786 RepID=UPI0018C22007|nr:hypothetical protein [Methylosinus sp. H3A]MBG0810342.1 hypothetical protein [Methylosinus sp. H3A]